MGQSSAVLRAPKSMPEGQGAQGAPEHEGKAGEGQGDLAEAETRERTSLSKVHLLSPCSRSLGEQRTPRMLWKPRGLT